MQFILGFIVGVLSIWLASFNQIRFHLYKEKLKHYNKIQDLSTQLFKCISLSECHETQYLKIKEDLMTYTSKHTHVLSNKIIDLIFNFLLNHDYENVKKNSSNFLHDFINLSNEIRQDLKIKSFEKIENTLMLKFSKFQKSQQKLQSTQQKQNEK